MFVVIGYHVVAEGQLEMADQMAREVGDSLIQTPGFLGRYVLQSRINPYKVWSIVAFEAKDSFDHWLKVRSFWWKSEDLERVYKQGAVLHKASDTFRLLDQQPGFFSGQVLSEIRLGCAAHTGPIVVVAPHLIEPEHRDAAMHMLEETGESLRRFRGFQGRLVIEMHDDPRNVWSVSTWKKAKNLENYLAHRQMPWSVKDVQELFTEGAMVHEALIFEPVMKQLPPSD